MGRPLEYPQLDPELVRMLIPLADQLNDLAEAHRDCSREMEEFNRLAGTSITEPLHFHFAGACTSEVFVRELLAGAHVKKFAGLEDADLLELFRSIRDAAHPDEDSFWLQVLELNLPRAPVSELIFYPDQALAKLGVSEPAPDDLEPDDLLRYARQFPEFERVLLLDPGEG